ncbi:LysR family transcriptional regulator [Actinomycetospora sp. TBRC 11914]|uniref:LysR family transcriptional regulator n=1 Tax=Actinomycetospora sp. TBRC 11914 TaxID=2729387 RepID=UPI00145F9EBB|nr:LysR family transcriptional regulator [Actinomycetospora sp. TBRC 11914]NMO91095.1 LysR family transcriptional regulator [Actinomycetospora sp. TBRC 11914]
MPTLRQFEAYLTVVDEGSFTRAAQRLGVSQPGLSQQVAALERELGSSLFSRLPRSVTLTPTGRALLPHARACVDAASRATTAARSVAGTSAGELRIAVVYSVGLGLLPGVLTRWRADHPGVGVRLLEQNGVDSLTTVMQDGQADVGIGPTPHGWRGRVRVLGTEELVVLLPPDGPPDVRGGEIALSRLADVAWVQYAPSHGLSADLDAAAGAAGFRPRLAVRTEQTAMAPQLVAAGIGPALVPAGIVPSSFTGRIARPVPRVERELAATTGAEPDALTSRFVALLARRAVLMPPHVAERLT